MLIFFKCLFNNWARAVIFELNEGTIYGFVKFKYQSSSAKKERPFEEEKA